MCVYTWIHHGSIHTKETLLDLKEQKRKTLKCYTARILLWFPDFTNEEIQISGLRHWPSKCQRKSLEVFFRAREIPKHAKAVSSSVTKGRNDEAFLHIYGKNNIHRDKVMGPCIIWSHIKLRSIFLLIKLCHIPVQKHDLPTRAWWETLKCMFSIHGKRILGLGTCASDKTEGHEV